MSYGYWCESIAGSKDCLERHIAQVIDTSGLSYIQKDYILDQELTELLKRAGKYSNDAIYMMLTASILTMLRKYKNEDTKFAFGLSTNNRILPVFLSVNNNDNFLLLIKNIKQELEELEANIDITTEELYKIAYNQLGCNTLKIEYSVIQVADVMSTYEPLYGEQIVYGVNITKDRITIQIQGCSNCVDEKTLDRYCRHIDIILRGLLLEPKKPICELAMLTSMDLKFIDNFNDTQYSYPTRVTVSDIIKKTSQQYGDSTAIIFKDTSLTYNELNKKSDSLAVKLQEWGVQRDSIVGLLIDRSFEMLISIFAIVKAGGAYLPILPSYPDSRIAYMLKDCNTKILLTSSFYVERLQQMISSNDVNEMNACLCNNIKIVNVEEQGLYEDTNTKPNNLNDENDLLYVIYTSGSTGKPKGVQITHKALINRISWMHRKYPICNDDVIMQKTSYCFDVSVWELLWGAFSGAAVYMLEPYEESNPEQILAGITKHNVSIIHFVPSMMSKFVGYMENNPERKSELVSLRYLFSSGEKLMPSYVNRFYSNCVNEQSKCLVVNLYGPTEAAIDVTYYDCLRRTDYSVIPIGRPIDNIQLYVVDENLKMLPIGVVGELVIGGVGLARGYQNREELTNERFVSLPELNQRVYRTGDLVRWLDDGNIEYISRNDQQVKIRGFRIELGEIESAIEAHEAIEAAAVIVRTNMDTDYLCACVVKRKPISFGVLKEYLTAHLPSYMVPNYYIQVDEIPVTSNGKLDKHALEEYPLDFTIRYDLEPLVTEREKEIAEIWSEILPNTEFYRNDNFFDVGGTSLDMISVFNRLEITVQGLTIQDLYVYDTIKSLAEYLDSLNSLELVECRAEIEDKNIDRWEV